MLGIKILSKEVIVPEEAKNMSLGLKRKRGRPSKAKKVSDYAAKSDVAAVMHLTRSVLELSGSGSIVQWQEPFLRYSFNA